MARTNSAAGANLRRPHHAGAGEISKDGVSNLHRTCAFGRGQRPPLTRWWRRLRASPGSLDLGEEVFSALQ